MLIAVLICYFCLLCVSSQECDRTNDFIQCSKGQICVNNVCRQASPCSDDTACATAGTQCVTGYCQTKSCSSTGECVHGEVCSRKERRTCVYPTNLKVEESTEFKLSFPEPAPNDKKYNEIGWLKGNTDDESRIVFFQKDMTDNKPLYFNEYCPDIKKCKASKKGELNTNTGDLTIHRVNFDDEDKYYYWFWVDSSVPDTGIKYEIDLEVYVKPKAGDLALEGLPNIVEVGQEVELTCIVKRIKPQAAYVEWEVNGRRGSGEITTVTNGDGKTFKHTSVIRLNFTTEDHGKSVRCTIKPVHGNPITIKKKVNVAHAPNGSPKVLPVRLQKYENETVVLTYETKDIDVGSPPCDTFTWNRTGDSNGTIIKGKNKLEFVMDESYEGNYTCKCSNSYGETTVSEAAEVIFVPGSPSDAASSFHHLLVVALAAGIPAIVTITIVAILVSKRKVSSRNTDSDETSTSSPTVTIRTNPLSRLSADPYYDDVMGNPRKSHHYEIIADERTSTGYLTPVGHSHAGMPYPECNYHYVREEGHATIQNVTIPDIFRTM